MGGGALLFRLRLSNDSRGGYGYSDARDGDKDKSKDKPKDTEKEQEPSSSSSSSSKVSNHKKMGRDVALYAGEPDRAIIFVFLSFLLYARTCEQLQIIFEQLE